MGMYLYCIEKSFEELTNIIKIINSDATEYEKYKNDLILYLGNTVHWIAVAYDKMPKKKFTSEERKLLSAFKAVDNNQKHELNCIEFQAIGNIGIKWPIDFSDWSFDPKGVIWKNFYLDETNEYANQNKNYNNLLRNNPVWNTLDEIIRLLKQAYKM